MIDLITADVCMLGFMVYVFLVYYFVFGLLLFPFPPVLSVAFVFNRLVFQRQNRDF